MDIVVRQRLVDNIKIEEGCSLKAYADPLYGWKIPTIGYGHTGGIARGDVWSQQQCDDRLILDMTKHIKDLAHELPWIGELDTERQDVLFDMCFNMGVSGLLKFTNTLAMIKHKNYSEAGDNMLKSLWAKQVGERAKRLSKIMNTGQWITA